MTDLRNASTTVTDLFDIRYGHSLELNKLERIRRPAGVNFVSRTSTNNGVTARVALPSGVDPGLPGELTVALSGNPLSTFIQPESFLTAYHVAILTPKIEMTPAERLWWCIAINANRYRYNYGRQANRTLAQLKLPNLPNFATPNVINTVLDDLADRLPLVESAATDPGENQALTVSELFNIRYGHSLELNHLQLARAPRGVSFVGRAAQNNGVTARVAIPPGIVPGEPGEITIALGGQGGAMAAFVQQSKFVCGRDVAILTPKNPAMTLAEKLWWCTCLWANHYRYNFGRQANRTLGHIELPERPPEMATIERMTSVKARLDTGIERARQFLSGQHM